MANTYAGARGYDKNRTKDTHRLGSEEAVGYAQTYDTFAECGVRKDGRGYLLVRRNGKEFIVNFNPESEPLEVSIESDNTKVEKIKT